MIKIEENQKSEAQIRLEKKLERDKEKLQEQVKKDQKRCSLNICRTITVLKAQSLRRSWTPP